MNAGKKILYGLVVFIILLFIGAYAFYHTKNIEVKNLSDEDRNIATGKFVKLSDGITHYEVGGADSAKTIVLVHGFSVPFYIWNGTFEYLVKQGFRVIRYDAFGRGFSDRPYQDYNPSFYRKQLFELVTALNVKTPFTIAGLSFGGAVVGDFAAHYPLLIDKIILIDPVYQFRKAEEPFFIVNFYMAINADGMANGQVSDFKYPQQFPDWATLYKPQMKYKGFRHALISTLKNYPTDTIISNYQKVNSLNKKVLLIWGKDDQTVTFNFSDSLKQKLKVDFFAVDDAGHLPHLEKPILVNEKIISFLKNQ